MSLPIVFALAHEEKFTRRKNGDYFGQIRFFTSDLIHLDRFTFLNRNAQTFPHVFVVVLILGLHKFVALTLSSIKVAPNGMI